MTPQIILTLSHSGRLQAELPFNGGRRLLQLDGHPSDNEAQLIRLLSAMSRGEQKLGQLGSPTQHEFHHTLHHDKPSANCPFCSLGLTHSARFCDKPKKRKISAATRAIVAAYEPPIDCDALGI